MRQLHLCDTLLENFVTKRLAVLNIITDDLVGQNKGVASSAFKFFQLIRISAKFLVGRQVDLVEALVHVLAILHKISGNVKTVFIWCDTIISVGGDFSGKTV